MGVYNAWGKRFFDISFVLILFVPVIILIIIFSIMIIVDIRCFPFFIQRRGIVAEKNFYMLKLRTLKKTQEHIPVDIFNKNGLTSRTSLFCNWIRSTGIDELPQFINILLGQMSVVGPRPFSINDLEQMQIKMPQYYERRLAIKSKPGLTGMWQIYANRDFGASNLLELEEEYEMLKCFSVDMKLLFRTFPFVIMRRTNPLPLLIQSMHSEIIT